MSLLQFPDQLIFAKSRGIFPAGSGRFPTATEIFSINSYVTLRRNGFPLELKSDLPGEGGFPPSRERLKFRREAFSLDARALDFFYQFLRQSYGGTPPKLKKWEISQVTR